MSFCGLTKGISPNICRLCVRDIINMRYFEPFMCKDLIESPHYSKSDLVSSTHRQLHPSNSSYYWQWHMSQTRDETEPCAISPMDVPLVSLTYTRTRTLYLHTCQVRVTGRRRLRSLSLYLCYVFRALIQELP